MASKLTEEEKKERHRAHSRAYRAANLEKVRASQRASYPKNREKRLAYQKDYYQKNRDKYRLRTFAWYQENKERASKNTAEWKRNNAQRVNEVNKKRRDLKKERGNYTAAEFVALCDSYGNACGYCGSADVLCGDHAVPLSRGGSNTIDNIVPSCHTCNLRKNNKTVEEFYEYLEWRAA